MIKFKQTLRRRVFLIRIFVAVFSLFLFNQQFRIVHWQLPVNDTLAGFQLGLLLGFEFTLFFLLSTYCKALRDEQALEKLYNKEHDERKIMIRQKSGIPVIVITSGIILFAAIIAGYFNIVVFYALIAAAFGQLMVCGILKLIYLRKY